MPRFHTGDFTMSEDSGPEFEGKIAGQEVRAKGIRFLDLVVGACLIYAVIVKPYFDDQRADTRWELMKKEHNNIAETTKLMAQSIAELSYIVSLDTDERKSLKLAMPDSMRERMYDDRRRAR